MKKIKILIGIVALVMLMLFAIGCGKGESDTNNSVTSGNASVSVGVEENISIEEEDVSETIDQAIEEQEEAEKDQDKDKDKDKDKEDEKQEAVTKPVEPAYKYYIKVNRKANCITIYTYDDAGNYTVPVKSMVCSVGKGGATPRGTYKTSSKYRWHELINNVYGQYCTRITGRVLFHSVPYSKYGDNSTLLYNSYNKLGSAASSGCIRLTTADAKWIYDNCKSGTTVEIFDSGDAGPMGKPGAVKISTSSPYRGWDPTDPDANNPWRNQAPTIKVNAKTTIEFGQNAEVLLSAANVSAVDYLGNALTVTVSGVDYSVASTYNAVFSATASNGKTAEVIATVIVNAAPVVEPEPPVVEPEPPVVEPDPETPIDPNPETPIEPEPETPVDPNPDIPDPDPNPGNGDDTDDDNSGEGTNPGEGTGGNDNSGNGTPTDEGQPQPDPTQLAA